MTTVREYIANYKGKTVGLNEIAAELNLTKKEVAAELLQFVIDTLKSSEKGLTITELKELTKLNRNWIAKQLDTLEIYGQVKLNTVGPAKQFFYSESGLSKWDRYYRALIENAHDIIVILTKEEDAHIKINYISGSLTVITGYRPDEVDEPFLLSHIHPDDRTIFESLDRVFKNESAQDSLSFRLLAKDGNYHHFDAVITDLRNNEDVRGLVLNCQDVTDTLILDRQLQYRTAFGQMMLIMATSLITAPDGELLDELSTNFNAIGKFMQQTDVLQTANYTADYLVLSILDPEPDFGPNKAHNTTESALKMVKQWQNPEYSLFPLDAFAHMDLNKYRWLESPINSIEPLFVPRIEDLRIPIDKLQPGEKNISFPEPSIYDHSMWVLPFRSAVAKFTGALTIIFHTEISKTTANQFQDLFHYLSEIFKGHLERISRIANKNITDLLLH